MHKDAQNNISLHIYTYLKHDTIQLSLFFVFFNIKNNTF